MGPMILSTKGIPMAVACSLLCGLLGSCDHSDDPVPDSVAIPRTNTAGTECHGNGVSHLHISHSREARRCQTGYAVLKGGP